MIHQIEIFYFGGRSGLGAAGSPNFGPRWVAGGLTDREV